MAVGPGTRSGQTLVTALKKSLARIRVDDLVEAISAVQRSDLEAWVRDELVTPPQEAGTLLFTDAVRAGPPHLHAVL